ncbi:MAG: TRAP transporter small permease subunit [Reichenbachiella sp.]
MWIIERFLRYGTLLSTVGFVGATIIQIYARFFMDSAPSWTEEASRFFFVYAMSFAAGIAMKDKEYVHLDLIYDRLTDTKKQILDSIISLTTVGLFLVIGIYAIQYISLGMNESSPSLGWSMAIAFSSILLMALSIGIYALVDFITIKRRIK